MITYTVTLTEQERQQLEAIKSKGSHRSQKVLNALILLNCDQGDYQPNGSTNKQICSILGISDRKINCVKKKFVEEGVDIFIKAGSLKNVILYMVKTVRMCGEMFTAPISSRTMLPATAH